MTYEQVADLALAIEDFTVSRRERAISPEFTRVTTIVALHGTDMTGYGEDVTYEAAAHDEFQQRATDLPLTDPSTITEFSTTAGDLDLFFGEQPSQSAFRQYRRWAFESAALDLALKQAETDLATQLGRTYEPVRFLLSLRLESPADGRRVTKWHDQHPALEFKIDPTSDWTADVFDRVVATDAVRTLDLKGQYEGTTVDQPADPELYARVLDAFPAAIIEDPALTEETRPLFDGHEDRVAWDYPIHDVASITSLPWEPHWINIKPSRFGSIQALFQTIAYCRENEIRMYGGGQFELDVGRTHLHALASVFYPDAPNDLAPIVYHDASPDEEVPSSPLSPPHGPVGLSWKDA